MDSRDSWNKGVNEVADYESIKILRDLKISKFQLANSI